MDFTRRAFLLAAGLLPSAARAFLESSRFVPAVARHRGRWDLRASGLRRLAWELQQRTSVETILEARPVALDSRALFSNPFMYFSSNGSFPPLTEAEVDNLRRFLTLGGFLFADANDGSDGNGFDASFRREIARILPGHPLKPLPSTHVVYRSFYLLDGPAGRVLTKATLDASLIDGRAAVIYTQNDILGALNRDTAGNWELEPSPGGERQRELAVRMALNVAMYALCLDYKDDAVHLPVIMRRRQ